ncbi:glycine receptor subunit alphaZ1-like [Limulus polyphemus]|uniref:Glycine receptor subunit alphaZ1-like n=1 Tax=Limulus polyphemus TaxID=6850 RepID=A0ABM1TAA9_LIMPO|nr:glycine receptor subunit alphaZ1-like [Limulus polyphemus]
MCPVDNMWFTHSSLGLLWILQQQLGSGSITSIKCQPVTEQVLPKDYERYDAPLEDGQPSIVQTEMAFLTLKSVDPETMTYETDIFLSHIWREPRLCDVSFSSINRTLEPKFFEELWRPDTYFYNAHSGTVQEILTKNQYSKLWSNKTIFFNARISLKLTCDMVLRNYPHDTQTCAIILKSLSYTDKELKLVWKRMDVSSQIVLPQHDVIKTETKEEQDSYGFGNFTRLTGIIHLKRRTGYFVIHTYIPSFLVVIMSMISFWLPPESAPARVALSVTSLLTLVTQQAKSSIPSISYVMAIDVWMLGCIAFVFATLVEYAFVSFTLQRKRKNTKGYTTKVNPGQSPSGRNQLAFETTKQPELKEIPNIDDRIVVANRIDRVSSFLFPSAFLIYIFGYLAHYLW